MITVNEKTRHNLSDNDWIMFKEVEGKNNLNKCEYQVQVLGTYTFKLVCNSKDFTTYDGKGMICQIKRPIFINYKSLADSFKTD